MKRTAKHTSDLMAQAERKISRLETENRKLKSDAAANPFKRTDLNLDALSTFLHEYGALVDATDPIRGRRIDPGGPSAEQDPEYVATEWKRANLASVDHDLRTLTSKIQAALGTPHGERVTIDADGKCVACGRQTRRRRTEVWRAQDGHV